MQVKKQEGGGSTMHKKWKGRTDTERRVDRGRGGGEETEEE